VQFEFLISSLICKNHDIAREKFRRQHLDKDKVELILDSDSEATEENSDETAEEDGMTEQAPVLPHQGAYKQNLVMDQLVGGVHDNTDDTSNNKVITNPAYTTRDVELGTRDRSDKH
jgi:hypothetical protein